MGILSKHAFWFYLPMALIHILSSSEYVERPYRFGQWTMDYVVI